MITHKIGDDKWYEINKLGRTCGLIPVIIEPHSIMVPQWWAGEGEKPLWFVDEYTADDKDYWEMRKKALMNKGALIRKGMI